MPMYSNRAGVMVLACAILSGCASSRPEPAPESLKAHLDLLAQRHHVCAVALAVIKDRKLVAIETASACSPAPHADSVFQAASLSKPVFAYAVLKLVAEGRLELDAPVVKYLPQGYRRHANPLQTGPAEVVTDPRLQAITVRMALNHTSGLPNWASKALSFEAAPGTRWHYSGEAYVLLQRAVETVTGEPLDRFIARQVFAPLAMRHSDYVWNARLAPYILPGTKANGAPRTTLDLKQPVAAFSLYTSAADYGGFLAALLNDTAVLGQIVASPVQVEPALGLDWGLGWGVEHGPQDRYIWQWGNNTGYRAFAIASLRTGDGFVMLTNSENGLELAKPLAARILRREPSLFQSPMLGGDLLTSLCTTVRLCL